MAKYRLLTKEELNELEKEFIEFLVINGITADKWEKLKQEEKEKAEEIIEQFSDVILESVLRKTQYLEHRSPQEIRVFQCLSNKFVLMGLTIDDTSINLTTPEGITKVKQQIPGTSVYTSEKPYDKTREDEIFELIQRGSMISDGKMFKSIALLIAEMND